MKPVMTAEQALTVLKREDASLLLNRILRPGETKLTALFRLIHDNNGLSSADPMTPMEHARKAFAEAVWDSYAGQIRSLDLEGASLEDREATFSWHYFSELSKALEIAMEELISSGLTWRDFLDSRVSSGLPDAWKRALLSVEGRFRGYQGYASLRRSVDDFLKEPVGKSGALTKLHTAIHRQIEDMFDGLRVDSLSEEVEILERKGAEFDPAFFEAEKRRLEGLLQTVKKNLADAAKNSDFLRELIELVHLESPKALFGNRATAVRETFCEAMRGLTPVIPPLETRLKSLQRVHFEEVSAGPSVPAAATETLILPQELSVRHASNFENIKYSWIESRAKNIDSYRRGAVLIKDGIGYWIDAPAGRKIEAWLKKPSQAMNCVDFFGLPLGLKKGAPGIHLVPLSGIEDSHPLKQLSSKWLEALSKAMKESAA